MKNTLFNNPAINTSTFVTYITQFTVPTTAKTLRVGVNSGTMANTNVLYVAETQLEIGLTATNFSRAGGTIQGELAACQRYYYRQTAGENFSVFGTGLATSTTNARICIVLPVTMRVKAASLEFSLLILYDGVTSTPITSAVVGEANFQTFNVNATVASGLTQFRPYQILANSNTSAHIGVTAEL